MDNTAINLEKSMSARPTKEIFDQANEAIDQAQRMALDTVLQYFGSAANMARYLDMTRGAVNLMMVRGAVGRHAAIKLHQDESIPFQLSDLRADYEQIEKTGLYSVK